MGKYIIRKAISADIGFLVETISQANECNSSMSESSNMERNQVIRFSEIKKHY